MIENLKHEINSFKMKKLIEKRKSLQIKFVDFSVGFIFNFELNWTIELLILVVLLVLQTHSN
ncbi:hypothetical protein EFO40_09805 [Lactococcus cremoris]|nr:hypothetical protein LLT5_07375 [Lactococcus cremoris subsp. cremoris TIFN5]EQC87717.1 hypothetical protein LLT1_09520 [Lactococcus cremoris subsp. cremoris TIFN1]MCT0459167.1 hypothetical protein [Lactococcus cremoris]OAJ97386.1 hypothetical protein A7U61_07965 [Lactococcus lactis]MCT4415553.1 hypothetical protein [Lactococcus cremoris]